MLKQSGLVTSASFFCELERCTVVSCLKGADGVQEVHISVTISEEYKGLVKGKKK
jgi:hypothetical protein